MSFIINPYRYVVAGGGSATISYVGSTVDVSNASVYTFTAHATGTAGTRKTIVAVSSGDLATAFSVSGVTVGGAAATLVVSNSADTGSLVQSAIFIIDNPSGTTANIVVTMSETVEACGISVWAGYDFSSETPVDTASQFQTSSAAVVLDLDVSSGGVGVGISVCNDSGQTVTWTGMTERAETVGQLGGTGQFVFSPADTTTSGTPLTVSADWLGTADAVGCSASWV
jgi:hypothetical protein